MPRSAWLLATALAGTALLAAPMAPLGLGIIGRAEAAQGYHTRKKVNGRWVSGKFRDKRGAAASVASAEPAPATAAADTPAPAAATTEAAPSAKTRGRVRFTERKSFAKARYASLPVMKAKIALKTEPPKDASLAVPLPPPAPIAQVPPAKPPVSSVANAELPPDRVLATASINPALIAQPGAERMRSALEARARTMASQFGVIAVPLPAAAPAARLTARSVTYDMGNGTRTIVFDDGASVTAPFDKARAETLNGLPGAR